MVPLTGARPTSGAARAGATHRQRQPAVSGKQALLKGEQVPALHVGVLLNFRG